MCVLYGGSDSHIYHAFGGDRQQPTPWTNIAYTCRNDLPMIQSVWPLNAAVRGQVMIVKGGVSSSFSSSSSSSFSSSSSPPSLPCSTRVQTTSRRTGRLWGSGPSPQDLVHPKTPTVSPGSPPSSTHRCVYCVLAWMMCEMTRMRSSQCMVPPSW